MAEITPEQRAALNQVANIICDVVKETGDRGAPGGIIYAALMAQGFSFNQFVSLMGILVRKTRVRQEGDLYFAV